MRQHQGVDEARRIIVQAMARLTYCAIDEPTLEARNLVFTADEFLNALDAYYRLTAKDQT